jgi:hypothetical protein
MPKQNQHEKPLDDILTGQECTTGVQKMQASSAYD